MQHAAVLVGRPHCECIFSLFGGVFNVKHLETLWTKSTTPDFMLKFYFYFKSFYIFFGFTLWFIFSLSSRFEIWPRIYQICVIGVLKILRRSAVVDLFKDVIGLKRTLQKQLN